jgi:FtsZ-binding cell division protein ZapB
MAEKDIVKLLRVEVERLIADHERVSRQCRDLTKERDNLLGQKHRLEERVREQDTRIKSLELAEVMRGGDGNVERAKARVNNLLREVDRCIALIKREQDNQ